jgi:hypothetical protein
LRIDKGIVTFGMWWGVAEKVLVNRNMLTGAAIARQARPNMLTGKVHTHTGSP